MRITPLVAVLVLLAGCGTQRAPESFRQYCVRALSSWALAVTRAPPTEESTQRCMASEAERWNRMDLFSQLDATGPGIPYGPGMWGSPGNRHRR